MGSLVGSLRANYGLVALTVAAVGSVLGNVMISSGLLRQRAALAAVRAPAAGDTLPHTRMVLVFQPADCPSGAGWIQSGNWASHNGTDVRGLVVDNEQGRDPVSELTNRAGIRFPMSTWDPRAAWHALNAMGYRSTPVAIVVDSQDRIVAVGRPEDLLRADSVHRARRLPGS